MIQTKARILVNDKIAPEYYKMALSSPELAKTAKPGQFVHIRVTDGYEPLLRRPFSIHSIKNNDIIEILYRVVGKGTTLLSEKHVGKELDILGPLGNGFKIYKENMKIVLIAGGAGIAPLFFLTQRLIHYSQNIIVLIGAKSKELILCEQEFKDLGTDVRIATEDGSYGYDGIVTDLLHSLHTTSTLFYACGPSIMLQEVTDFSIKNNLPCQLSLESRMACGLGACLGCAIKVKNGSKTAYKRVCKDGPVFDAKEIIWE
jgi:dihydroorotate dehydrogenase electron transfer subunit